MNARPVPGSTEALEAGCLCPVMDNNHGKWPPRPPDGWFIRVGCPVHYATPSWLRPRDDGDEGLTMLGKGMDDE